jgi:hypothetical protein
MSRPGVSWWRCVEPWALLAAALAAAACQEPERVQIGQVMRMGQYVLRADAVRVYSRAHQGVPLEVKVEFTLGGGNRFDRLEFAETVSSKGQVFLAASGGWRERCWLSGVGEDQRQAEVVGNPPDGSTGFTLEIGNPYGEPKRFVLDLGKQP